MLDKPRLVDYRWSYMEKRREEPESLPSESENQETQREMEIAAAERQFFGALRSEAKDTREKAADTLFAGSREFIGAMSGTETAEALKPLLEQAAKSADIKTQEAAKQALARLELGST